MEVSERRSLVTLYPLTSKERWGRCKIELPLDDRVLRILSRLLEPRRLKAKLFAERCSSL